MRKSSIHIVAFFLLGFWVAGCRQDPVVESVSSRTYPPPGEFAPAEKPAVSPGTTSTVPPPAIEKTAPKTETAPSAPPKTTVEKSSAPAIQAAAPAQAPSQDWVENRGQPEYVSFLESKLSVRFDELRAFLEKPETRSAFNEMHEQVRMRTQHLQEFNPYGDLSTLSSTPGFVAKKDRNCPDQALSPACDRLATIPFYDKKSGARVPVVARWNAKNFPIELGVHASFDPKYLPILALVVRQYNAWMASIRPGNEILRLNSTPSNDGHENLKKHLVYFSDYDYPSRSYLAPRHDGLGHTYQIMLATGEILDADIDIAFSVIDGMAREAAQLPGAPDDAETQIRSLILYYALAHEVGHWLGMDHNFYSEDYKSIMNYYTVAGYAMVVPSFFDSQGQRSYDYLTFRYMYDDAFVDIQGLPYQVVRELPDEKKEPPASQG